MSNVEVAKMFFKMIEHRQLDNLRKVIHPEYTAQNLMINKEASEFNIMEYSKLNIKGIHGIEDRIKNMLRQFDNIKFEIYEIVEQENKVVFHYVINMDHTGYWKGFPPSGKRLRINGVHLMYFKDKKIIEIVPLLNIIDLLKQIGAATSEMTEKEILDYLNRVKQMLL